jgi:hypothetical protein
MRFHSLCTTLAGGFIQVEIFDQIWPQNDGAPGFAESFGIKLAFIIRRSPPSRPARRGGGFGIFRPRKSRCRISGFSCCGANLSKIEISCRSASFPFHRRPSRAKMAGLSSN